MGLPRGFHIGEEEGKGINIFYWSSPSCQKVT